MKKISACIFLFAALFGYTAASFAEGEAITGSASIGIFNRYIVRGYEYGTGSIIVQPSVTAYYKGLSANLFANIDTKETSTQAFTPYKDNSLSLNEVDVTLSYTYSLDKVSFTGGYIYYGTRYFDETHELFVTAAYASFLNPTLTIYRNIAQFPATYINLALSHSLNITKDTTLDLGASAGYLSGDDDIYRTEGGSGSRYKAFHDGMIKAGLTIPLSGSIKFQPVVQYWFPLSGKAGRPGYNPFGHLDETFVAGCSIVYSF